MSYANATSRYLENDIVSLPNEWLVPLLYEHLVVSLRRAAVHIECGSLEEKAVCLGKATSITGELLSSLDYDRGGEIAQRLSALYAYFALEILNVGRTSDLAVLQRLIVMVTELHEAWIQAAEQVAPRNRAASRQLATSAA